MNLNVDAVCILAGDEDNYSNDTVRQLFLLPFSFLAFLAFSSHRARLSCCTTVFNTEDFG